MEWEPVIGLEVHAQLITQSKLFSSSATHFGRPPNSQTSYLDAALPGTLPVLNHKAVHLAIQFGLAIEASIDTNSYFERKNYFYPDLPKGYQISQFQKPIVGPGFLRIEGPDKVQKNISILRAHLEEDAGKSLHDLNNDCTGIDLNRAGIPLLEIVTTPCIYSATEAVIYLKTLHQLLRFLGICDGNMQEGSFRCDVNISLKQKGSETLGTRVELKNLNSFRFIEKAIEYEIKRQTNLLDEGIRVRQETRLFNPDTQSTHVLRAKEDVNDYRYFTDPDLLPIFISSELLATIKQQLPPLPQNIKAQLSASLNDEDIQFLLMDPDCYHFFCAVQEQTPANPKLILNWMRGPYHSALKTQQMTFSSQPLSIQQFAKLLTAIHQQSIPTSLAKQWFTRMWDTQQSIEELLDAQKNETGVDEQQIMVFIKDLVDKYPAQAQQYRQGKQVLLQFFVGQIMKETKGQANPEQVSQLLAAYLG